jgi:molybdopterin molybdotransferase
MSSTAQSAGVVSYEQAVEIVLEYCRQISPSESEEVPLLASLGRVLAEAIKADRDFPPFPRATRDGFALRAADLEAIPAKLRVIGQIKAGANFSGTINLGEAVEIMTGAAVPQSADAVVMVEYTSRNPQNYSEVEIKKSVVAGENIVAAGAEARAGQELLKPGLRIDPARIALVAAVGKARLQVFRRPNVAILSTGDELVELAEKPDHHQIHNSNSYSLAAQVALAGAEPLRLPIAPDEERKLATLIHAGLAADMLLLSGGVSMGKFDLVEQALARLGADFFFTGALVQPGRPVVFGEVSFSETGNGSSERGDKPHDPGALGRLRSPARRRVPFFGLPGNPISAMVCFDLFARPVLDALSGATATRLPTAKARLKKDFKTKTGLTRFLPAVLSGGLYDPEVELVPWQGSGDLAAQARANCYLVVPPDREVLSAGEMVSVVAR